MSVMREVEVLRFEVGDDYSIEATVFDVDSGKRATVALTDDEVREARRGLALAVEERDRMLREDRPHGEPHGFDVDAPATMQGEILRLSAAGCSFCATGWHGRCIGSEHREVDGEIAEVECRCARVTQPGSIS